MTQAGILIVDDDAQIRRTLRATLVPQGYGVSDARSGEEALEKLRDEKTDVVLLDLNMPGMGGLATCREIRRHSDVAIIVVTVRDSETDKVQVLDAGADDYVTKPFSTPELLARIRAALRRLPPSPDAGPDVLHLEGVTIDFAARRVIVRGEESRLTPKELDLLRFLVANTNTAIPHRKLLQAIWGPDYGDEVEYLRVFINHLRKKIEPNPARPKYLLTEPWVGYRFSLPPKK
ncbi:MAG TPA: response regulator transcription factor [Candidatus Acidoferrales bacterium]|nr:response regulator transcription factor [Candidatus Acidoferrales bacterium]